MKLQIEMPHISSPRTRHSVRFVALCSMVLLWVAAPLAFAQAPDTPASTPSQTGDQTPPSGAPLPSKDPDVPGQPKPSLLTPLAPQTQSESYTPITGRQRARWVITETIDPSHSIGGIFTSAYGTAVDHPVEYGPHWDGFAKRYGLRTSGVATSNTIEAGIGAVWGEDPRYFALPGRPFKARLRNIVKQTFIARRSDGEFAPAYARFVGITGSNFLSNEWRPDSEADTQHALIRTGEGFVGRMGANAFEEFWPDVKRALFHRGGS